MVSTSGHPDAASLEIDDPGSGRRIVRLEEGTTSLGRGADNEIQILIPHVSKRHAEIRSHGDGFVLVDTGSKAGVYVNGTAYRERALANGDVITLGPTPPPKIVFRSGATARPRTEVTSLVMSLTESTGQQSLEKLSKFLEFSRLLGGQLTLAGILQDVVDMAIEITAADRGFLILVTAQGDLDFQVSRRKGKIPLAVHETRVSEGIVREALQTGKTRVVSDMGEESKLAARASVVSLQLGSAVAMPMFRFSLPEREARAEATEEVFGVLYLDSRDRRNAFSKIDIGILETLARDASSVIENARLLRESEEKQKMEQELATAREVQAALLPQSFWSDPHFEVAGCCIPCLQLGGDYQEQFRMLDGRCGLVIADVSGKGLPAALMAAALQGILSAETSIDQPLDRMVGRVNRAICKLAPPGSFISMFCGLLAKDGDLRYVDAGHGYLKLASAGGLVDCPKGRMLALGLDKDAVYRECRLKLEPGDVLALYTDGVTEASDPAGEELFGEDRVGTILEASKSKGAEEIVETIRGEVASFCGDRPFGDDLTLLVLKYLGVDASRESLA